MIYDNAVEEIQPVQFSRSTTKAVIEEKIAEQMEIEECEFLQNLFMSPAEKIMMEFDGSSKDLRGLFRTPKENNAIGSLHQQEISHCLDCSIQKMNRLETGFPEQMDVIQQMKNLPREVFLKERAVNVHRT